MEIRKIAILTSGGDAPGMNAAIRAVVRTANYHHMEVIGVYRGYAGLLKKEFRLLLPEDTADTIERGGTMLYTARCKAFYEREGVLKGIEALREEGVDALVAIGGDGTFRGAKAMADEGFPVIGIPATIDLDLGCTEYSIGFDTAVNTAMEAIDKVRDTSTSHERISIIEVMGRRAGYIALWSGIACGSEEILLPETYDYNDKALVDRILQRENKGKKQHIIVNAEGIGESEGLARRIENLTGIETRATILGYMQRGGSPTAKDRVTASQMGSHAVLALLEGRVNRVVVMQDGRVKDIDIQEALKIPKVLPEDLMEMTHSLVRS